MSLPARERDGVEGRQAALERALIVVNPAAGSVTRELVDRAAAICRRHAEHVSIVRASDGRAAVELTAAAVADGQRTGRRVDAVVAVGGDATACEVAEGVVRSAGHWDGAATREAPPALLLIPAGRGNSAYRAIWGDSSWEDVLESALSGTGGCVRNLDLLHIAEIDRASLLGLNAGLLARIVRLAADEPATGTALERYSAVMGPALAQFRPYQGRVIVDGRCVVDGMITQVTVGGLRAWAAGVLEILPRSVLDDGQLDVCVIGEITDRDFADLGPLLGTGSHLDLPYVTYAQGRSVVLERCDGEPLELEHDGDAWIESTARSVTLEMLRRVVPVFTAVDPSTAGDRNGAGGVGLYTQRGRTALAHRSV